MSDMNACAECGYTTQNFAEFTLHIQRHEESANEAVASGIETTSKTTDEKVKNEKSPDSNLFAEQNNNSKEKSSDSSLHSSILLIANDSSLTKSSINSTKSNQVSGSIGKKQIEADVLNQSNISCTTEPTNTTAANTMIENAQMLASIADLSGIFNNTTTANEQNINCPSTVIDVESKRLNLSNYFGKDFAASSLNSSSQRASPNAAAEESKPYTYPFSLDLTSPNVKVSETLPSNTGRNSGVERARSVKTRKECPHCNFTTYMSQHMKSHLEAHERHRGQMYQCDICHTEFSQKANMHRHRTRHSGIKPYRCRFCYKEFFRKDQMQEHSMTHIKTGDDFDCPVAQCLKQFNQHQALRQHLDEDHAINASQQACCKRCALLFSNSRRLLLHYQTKHDDYQKLGSVKSIKNDNTKSSDLKTVIEAGSLINNTPTINILADKVNDVSPSSDFSAASNQHLSMLAATASISPNNTNSNKNSLAVNNSKRRNQRSNSSSTPKRAKPDKTFGLNGGINATASYNVDELLKNQNYLTSIDHFTHLSSVMPSSSAKTVNGNDALYSASAPNLRIIDEFKGKLNEDHKLHGKETLESNINHKAMLVAKSENNTMFSNVFNENAALVTSIALARKALEFRNGLAAALSASNSNSSFNTNPILSNSITSMANNSVDVKSSLNYLTSLSSFSPSKNISNLNESLTSMQAIAEKNNAMANNSEINNEYLPRSKSPDYQNLIQNGYKLTSNELLMKLAGNLQNNAYNKSKPSLHHHMQLWTNEANSATTTTVSSASINGNIEEDEHENDQEKHKAENGLLLNVSAGNTNHHSATHSPTASSSSVSSLISINGGERSPPLTQIEKMSSELLTIAKKSGLNLTPEKPISSFLLNVSHNTSIERDNVSSLNLSPSSASSALEQTQVDQTSNNSMLFGSSDLQNSTGSRDSMECLPCGIIFTDQTLYLLHKGLHSESDAWRCNLCGHTCSDKYTFTTHLISFDHS